MSLDPNTGNIGTVPVDLDVDLLLSQQIDLDHACTNMCDLGRYTVCDARCDLDTAARLQYSKEQVFLY